MPPDPSRRHHAVSLQQAAQESPLLARLVQLVHESSQLLQAVRSQVPPSLHGALRAGPLDGHSWCLLVRGNAAAAKLRQLLPAMQAHLKREGWPVEQIRIKVQNDWT